MKTFTVSLGTTGTLTAYLPDASPEMMHPARRPAVLVAPGGAYRYCSDREAEPVAIAYLAQGFATFVLRYATGDGVPWGAAFDDGRAALAWIQEHAAEHRVDAGRVAVAGFSAGGHLAVCLGTADYGRPDALILGYPVTLAAFGAGMGKEIPDLPGRVDADMPPTFVFATQGDPLVPIEHSLRLLAALAEHAVPFEAHLGLLGGHGLSLATAVTANGEAGATEPAVADWFVDSVRFLRGVLDPFPLAGRPPSFQDVLDARRPGVDMPIGRLVVVERAAALLDAHAPAVRALLTTNPLLSGASLSELSRYSPESLDPTVLERLREAFASQPG